MSSTNGLAFGSGVGTFNLVSLAGSGNFALTDTASQPVNLVVGSNNASTSYSGNLIGSGSLTKVGSGVLALTGYGSYSGATYVTSGTIRLGSTPTPGLYLGLVSSTQGNPIPGQNGTNGGVLLPIPTSGTSDVYGGIQLGPLLAQSTNSNTTVPPGQLTTFPQNIGNNMTVGYSGYINNTTGAPVTYTFAENFDNCVVLVINGQTVLNDTVWNNPTEMNVTLNPGSNSFQLYLGQGGGGVGPSNGGWLTNGLGFGIDFLGRDAQVASDFVAPVDPGNGSLFSTTALSGLSGSVVMSSNTTLDVTNLTASIGSLADASGGETGAQVLLGTSGTLITGTDNTSTTFSGVISGTGGNLTKAGTGTLTLAGPNTYGGSTTISGGAVQLNVANALQNSTATVNVNGGLASAPALARSTSAR